MPQVTALFMRVSTRDQKHDRQKTILRDWSHAQGLKEGSVRWYSEKISGAAAPSKRSALRALMRDVEAGRVHTVAVERLDRLSRSTRTGLQVLADLAAKGVRVVAIQQALDLSGATGKFLSALFLALGEWERDQLASRVKEGMEAAREAGKHVGRPRDQRKYREVAKLRAEGYSVIQIADKMKISRQACYYLLNQSQAEKGIAVKTA
jgi:DNA invertase Pin-like site-specific DNA recombinase